MSKRTISGYVIATLLMGLCMPIMMGTGGCPPPTPTPTPAGTVLVDQTDNLAAQAACQNQLDQISVTGPQVCQLTMTFIPTEAGKTVNVSVSGDITASRIQMQVTDPNNNVVVNFNNPTTNASFSSFVVTAVGPHTLLITETAFASSIYRTYIEQLP